MRKTYLQMIKAFPGGWEAMAAALGMTKDALENRVYERKGQGLLEETVRQMQQFSATTLYAEAVALDSGGVFMVLPRIGDCDNVELMKKFNQLNINLGALSAEFSQSITGDDEIDENERRRLEVMGQHIHRTVAELLSVMFKVYCKQPGTDA